MNRKLQSLDILKGIGILMIIMVHNRHFIMKDMSGLRRLINYGQMGCQLFFVVSGMALCHSWFHMADKYTASDGRFTVKNRIACSGRFILRRYLRLAPGFVIILCVNFLLNVLFIDVLDHYPGFVMNREPAAILKNLLFLHGLFPDCINSVFPGGWYIGTAFLLYILFPLLVSVFEKLYAARRGFIFMIPVLLLSLNCIVIRIVTDLSQNGLYLHNDSFLYYFFTNQLPCFSLGILLYFQEKTGFSSRCPLPVAVLLFAITCHASIRLYLLPEQDDIYAVLPTLAGFSFYWLAVCLIHAEQSGTARHGRKFPPVDFLAKCGSCSYGMYLVHSFVSWYGMKELTGFLTRCGCEYQDLFLYWLVYLPSVFVICVLGRCMTLLVTFIDKKIR